MFNKTRKMSRLAAVAFSLSQANLNPQTSEVFYLFIYLFIKISRDSEMPRGKKDKRSAFSLAYVKER